MSKLRTLLLAIRSTLLAAPLNLRAKLVAGNVVIVLVALVAMGYYVFFRAQQSNLYLSNQLDESVRQQAEDGLSSLASDRALALNTVFAGVRDDITKLGATTKGLLSQEAAENFMSAWDANQALSRLPGGSWDNSNSEPGSLFLPAAVDLSGPLASHLGTLKQLDFVIPSILATSPDAIAVYFGGESGETLHYPNIDLATIVPPDFDVTSRPWYLNAAPEANLERRAVWSTPYLDAALHGLVVTSSAPVFDEQDNFRGVVAMDVQLLRTSDIVSQVRVGQTGFAFLLDSAGHLIAAPEAGYSLFAVSPESITSGEILERSILRDVPIEVFEVLVKMTTGQTGLRTVKIGAADYFIAYRPLPAIGYSLGLMVPVDEMLTTSAFARQQIEQTTTGTIAQSALLVAIVLLVSFLASLAIGRGLTSPLAALTRTAEQVAAGDLQATAEVQTKDEVGLLAATLNSMTANLRGLVESLEQRVAERTSELDRARQQSEKRAVELQTIAEISTLITSEQDIESLLPLVTGLVADKFGFYHAGIFLLDEGRNFAILKASNSAGGQRMLARGHRLEVGKSGIVGQVAATGQPRIALDAGADPVFFDNPDLPETRSEMALPLVSRAQTIGVLDVQSVHEGAFTSEDANNLRILADQVASVIENASLHGQTQEALAEARVLYRQYLQRGWQDFLETEGGTDNLLSLARGNTSEEHAASAQVRKVMESGSASTWRPDGGQGPSVLLVPLKLRGTVLGVLHIRGQFANRDWTRDEMDIAEAAAERLALALESARLLQDSQRRAAKERAISEITAKVGASIDGQVIVETAVQELGRALPGSDIRVDLQVDRGPGAHADLPADGGVTVPISLRGERIGGITLRQTTGHKELRPDQMDLVLAVAERVALSLENARLFEETSRRAERERLVTEITTKIRGSNDPEEMIRTAVDELRQALGVSRVEVIPQRGVPHASA
jgi:GAF domain-containing protein/HAMP domain-containing protein